MSDRRDVPEKFGPHEVREPSIRGAAVRTHAPEARIHVVPEAARNHHVLETVHKHHALEGAGDNNATAGIPVPIAVVPADELAGHELKGTEYQFWASCVGETACIALVHHENIGEFAGREAVVDEEVYGPTCED